MGKQSKMDMSPRLESAMINIMDTFSGADGGVSFMNLRGMLESLDKDAANGDAAAPALIQMVLNFSRLIDAANGRK